VEKERTTETTSPAKYTRAVRYSVVAVFARTTFAFRDDGERDNVVVNKRRVTCARGEINYGRSSSEFIIRAVRVARPNSRRAYY